VNETKNMSECAMSTGNHDVLATGGAVFIGSHLVDRLIGIGCDVVVVDNLSVGRLENLNRWLKSSWFKLARARSHNYWELHKIVKVQL
jgi:UDP-glucose 4-epimerase